MEITKEKNSLDDCEKMKERNLLFRQMEADAGADVGDSFVAVDVNGGETVFC